tara:strand:+ start:400 stop:630 length:231 start_codon:yes stop_codon:yes gene_type:complete
MEIIFKMSREIGNANAKIENALDKCIEILEAHAKIINDDVIPDGVCIHEIIDELKELNTDIDEKLLTYQLRIQGEE